jgi:hypothetical protein
VAVLIDHVLDVVEAEEKRMKEREAQREIERRNIKAAEKRHMTGHRSSMNLKQPHRRPG